MEGVGFDQFLLSPAEFLKEPPSEAVWRNKNQARYPMTGTGLLKSNMNSLRAEEGKNGHAEGNNRFDGGGKTFI